MLTRLKILNYRSFLSSFISLLLLTS